MWHTPDGDRMLLGAEATLIKVAITGIVEALKEESGGYQDQLDYGIALFDELPDSQRLVLLEQVATYLLTSTSKTLELTAVNEAAIGAIFEHVQREIDREVADCQSSATAWRAVALAAYRGCFCEEEGESEEVEEWDEVDFVPSSVDSVDRGQWRELLESLIDRILWDRDYELAATFLDAPPSESRTLKDMLGIDADYFAAAAPDVADDEQFQRVYGRLDQLAGPDRP